MIRPLILAGLTLLLVGASPPAPRRIVSLNLCADQLLIALADPRQVAALTRLSIDPALSAEPERARRYRTIRGSAEDVLALKADLILAAPGWREATVARLRDRGVRIVTLEDAPDYATIRRQIREVAAAIGRPERGEALIARMDAALAAVPRRAGRGRTAAYYQRRGFLTGQGTMVDELMQRVGLVNLAGRLGKPVLARVGLEELALARPDYLVVETGTDRVADRGTELLHHPLIAGIPRLRLPEAWTVCGGPAYVRAARSMARQLER